MSRRRTRLAAAALAAAAIVPWAAGAAPPPDPLAGADAAAAAAEAQLLAAEAEGLPAPEAGPARAELRRAEGERRWRRGEWRDAALLLTVAVDEPAWRGSPARPGALFQLADALRRGGDCAAARVRFAEYLALGHTAHRPAAVAGALDCAVKERRPADVERLLAEAGDAFGDDPPAEVRYLSAKALFHRTDLPEAERIARARDAFARVGPPYRLQGWYFEGVLALQAQDLAASLAAFERCARAPAQDARDREVNDLCRLALGRVHADAGDPGAAISWYRAVSWESPRLAEALHELAVAHLRARQPAEALSVASFVPEIAPRSPVASDATLLRGQLLARLERYGEAAEAFDLVLDEHGPARDRIDALLARGGDPSRVLDGLARRRDGPGDPATALPPVALERVAREEEVAAALGVAEELERAQREVKEATDLAGRLGALLDRGGLEASPALRRSHARAGAVENAVVAAEAAYVSALGLAVAPALGPEERAALDRARGAREAVEPRFAKLPRTPAQADERLARTRGRVDAIERAAFRLALAVDSCLAAIRGAEAWLEEHRAEIADDEGRRALVEQLGAHRGIVEEYGAELEALRQEIAVAREAAGAAPLAEESRLRAEYLEALERERLAAAGARLAAPERALLERVEAAVLRLAVLRSRAQAVAAVTASEAARRAAELRAQLGADRVALADHGGALAGIQADASDVLDRVAVRSLEAVRRQLHALVLQADVGLSDVAWSRTRQRLERIRQLAAEKDAAVERLDRQFRSVLREVD